MSKEYECFGYKDMMNLMSAIKAYDYDGWQLVSVGHNGKFYFAVVQRDKIETEESEKMKFNVKSEKTYTITLDDKTCSLLMQALKYADLHIIELPVYIVKSNESLLSDIRFFIKEFTSRMSEEE